jgi:uncharacterized membrane protein
MHAIASSLPLGRGVLLFVALLGCLAVYLSADIRFALAEEKLPAAQTIPADANQPPPVADTSAPSRSQRVGSGYLTSKTPYEFYLAGLTIFLGVSALVLVSWLFRKHLQEKTDEFVKLFAFVIVSFAAIFLIVAGYADSQVAPAYSLLGTIIGYVFGRDSAVRRTSASSGDGGSSGAASSTSTEAGPRPTAPST